MPGQDLTRVTIPSWFLEPRSLLERLADTLMHPDVLLRAAEAATPVERMRLVVAWFLSGFHYKTVVRGEKAERLSGCWLVTAGCRLRGVREIVAAQSKTRVPPPPPPLYSGRQEALQSGDWRDLRLLLAARGRLAQPVFCGAGGAPAASKRHLLRERAARCDGVCARVDQEPVRGAADGQEHPRRCLPAPFRQAR